MTESRTARHPICLALLAAGSLACLAATASAAPRQKEAKPNVLFLNIDDLRDVWHFDPPLQTPHLDRLAKMGMRFDRAYVQATFCNPSRTSFLTGLRPPRTGVTDNRAHFRQILPEVVTLPQLFRRHGYRTVRLGKIFHGAAAMDDPRSWDRAEYPKGTPLGRRGERWHAPGGEPRWCWALAAEGNADDQPDGQIAGLAVEFLRKQHAQPFFLAVGFHKPHDPFVAPKRYFNRYPREELSLHATPEGASPTPNLQIGGRWKEAFDRFTEEDRRRFLQSYYAATTFMDAQVGRVLDALDEADLLDRTIIVGLSDHGYHLGERGWWNKATLYEYSARAPLWIYVPDMATAGQTCSQPVEFVDIYPTLAALCGLSPPEGLDGRTLAPLLADPAAASWQGAARTFLRRRDLWGQTVRTERWRLVQWGEGEAVELFDHRSDPQEWQNLADQPEHEATIQRLGKLLLPVDGQQ